jgi:hypothetical protein
VFSNQGWEDDSEGRICCATALSCCTCIMLDKSTGNAAGVLGQRKMQGKVLEGGKKEGRWVWGGRGGITRRRAEAGERAEMGRTPLPRSVQRKVSFSFLRPTNEDCLMPTTAL